VVLDLGIGHYMRVLLEIIGVDVILANSESDFITQVDLHAPHLALVHISQLNAILRLKTLPAGAATPTVVVNAFGGVAGQMMSEAGLLGPVIDIPYAEEDIRATMELFGRSEEQPFPEPVPYLLGDPSLKPHQREAKAGERRILISARDEFYRVFLSRILYWLGEVIVDGSTNFEQVSLNQKPGLVLVLDSSGFLLRRAHTFAAKCSVAILALAPARNWVRPEDLNEDGVVLSLHALPMDRTRLLQLVEDALVRCFPERT